MLARYHLRFQIHPSSDVASDAAALAKACSQAGVAEVVLLVGAEELHTGHLAGVAEDRWFEAAARAGEVLMASGLDVSLNPWVTTGHADRGRCDRLGFTPMVSPTGEVAATQASFACPRWREWLCAHYGRFAELGFRVLWLEDDFRFHNHAPLTWGGGFEPLMLDRLARLVGRPLTREQVVAAVVAPGPPHPMRALLQQVWREAQIEVAQMVSRVVAERSAGRSRLGLMSSQMGAASVEGRDWSALFAALSGGTGRVVQRPHFAPYSDAPGRTLSYSVWMLEAQRALRPAGVSSEPEIENWPHTAWSKSDTQTWSEMVTAQLAGSDALLLNLHPTYGKRAERDPAIGTLLQRSRPALDWVAERRPEAADSLGVGLPFRQDSAAHIRTTGPADLGFDADLVAAAPAAPSGTARDAQLVRGLDELAVDPAPTAGFLLGYGVPVTARPAPVQALFGPAAWTFDDAELRRMLAGGLLLDGVAAAVLDARGFGDLIGVRVIGTVDRDEPNTVPGPYSMERVNAAGADGTLAEDTLLSVNMQPALARLEPLPGSLVWTDVVTADGTRWGAGRCGFVNELGGRVAVLAATRPQELPRDETGQHLLHSMVRFAEGDHPQLPLVSGGPYLIPQLTRTPDGTHRLAVANGSADPAHIHVDIPAAPAEARAMLLAPLAEPAPADCSVQGSTLHAFAVPHRAWLVFEW